MEVFEFNGAWYAFFYAYEYESDGAMYAAEVTAVIFFNEAGDRFYSPVMDCWFIITEDNTLVPTECEHTFDAEGYCIYCGYGHNNSGSSGKGLLHLLRYVRYL